MLPSIASAGVRRKPCARPGGSMARSCRARARVSTGILVLSSALNTPVQHTSRTPPMPRVLGQVPRRV